MNEKCPICGSDMEEWHDSLDGWCLLEDYSGCPNGCYSYYYYTGTTEITVRGKVFSYYHSYTEKAKRRINQAAERYLKFRIFTKRVFNV